MNAQTATPPELWTTRQAAEYLGFGRKAVDALCQRGELPAVKVGGRWFIVVPKLIEKFGGAS